jgi:hypothetical protein
MIYRILYAQKTRRKFEDPFALTKKESVQAKRLSSKIKSLYLSIFQYD